MAGRIARVRRGSGAALGALAALAMTACGLRSPLVGTGGTDGPATVAPSPARSPASAATPPSPSPPSPGTPSPGSPSPAPQPPTGSPVPGPTVVVGRPLRLRRRPLAPDVGRGEAPRHPDAARLARAPRRDELAALWLHAARMEHASVPAFAELASLLAAAGAPLDLVAAAHAAALDEVRHTEVSYALANAYGPGGAVPGALPRLLGRRVGSRLRGRAGALRRLAVEALRDGCVGEGYAAALAAAGAATAADPALREAFGGIARDEAAHAELSWRVLGWSLDAGGTPVAAAVARALRSLPAAPALPTERADLEAYGWPAPATAEAAYAAVLLRTAERAGGLLALYGWPSR